MIILIKTSKNNYNMNIDLVWEKGLIDDQYDPQYVRKDACGAWILREHYGSRESFFGWEIDHIYPKTKLAEMSVPEEEIDNILNLRPLNWRNNEAKGDNYPIYQAAVIAEGDRNILHEEDKEINKSVQKQLQTLYSSYLENKCDGKL